MYKRLLLFLLAGLLAACNGAAPDSVRDLHPLKETAWFMDRENLRLLQLMNEQIETQGNRPRDVAERQKAEGLVELRKDFLQGNLEAADYTAALAQAYQGFQPEDTESLIRLQQLQERSRESGDSLAYRQFLLQIFLIENSVLNEYARRLTPRNVLHPPSWQLIKPMDTLALGGVYEFSIIPNAYDFTTTQIRPDSSLSIRRNGQAVAVKNKLWLKSGVLLGEVHPLEAGTYNLSGSFEMYNPLFGVRLRSEFTDAFVVK
ncbi:hypothetical protein [Cesiribacter andamanensis]|uniref:Gliding motility-associated protein GldM N-terminal domain-containing protein n=1 Tax=Cesiribacter andamanensis AMV16 TaxID=1279009 RepID=M7N7K2_9BACT|nr:hypothetical protein [Cesiribacter andamanensis]EMR03211.1 hypothetical protein ADICEAN_01604 [Cesiribacter andamanensis AMV16]